MRRNHKILFFAIGILFTCAFLGCAFASFTDRPGVEVKGYPKEMYGTWMNIVKENGSKDTNYISIDEKGLKTSDLTYQLIDLDNSENSLTHLGDYYYLNIRKSDSLGMHKFFVYPFEFNEKHMPFLCDEHPVGHRPSRLGIELVRQHVVLLGEVAHLTLDVFFERVRLHANPRHNFSTSCAYQS